jgi:hypothetical protein
MSSPNVQIYINGVLHKQYLTQSGIVSIPTNKRSDPSIVSGPIMYPTTHSMPGPYLLSYMRLPR